MSDVINIFTGNVTGEFDSNYFNARKSDYRPSYTEVQPNETGGNFDLTFKVNDFFQKTSVTSDYKIKVNKTFIQILNFLKEALDYYDINYLHMINKVEDALTKFDDLWCIREKLNNKYNLYSLFINLLQTQLKCIVAERISKEQIEYLINVFDDLTIDSLNQDFIIKTTIGLSNQKFPLFEDLL